MALTGKRWILAALLGCLTLAVVYWPGAAEAGPSTRLGAFEYRHRAAQFLESFRIGIGNRLALLERRDSILPTLPGARAPGSSLIVRLARRPQGRAGLRLTALTDSVVRHLVPNPSGIVTALIELDQAGRYRLPLGHSTALWGTWYLMPEATDGHTCLILSNSSDFRQLVAFVASGTASNPVQDVEAALVRQLGPCLFYTAFGAPGREIARWLRSREFAVAARADWSSPRPAGPRVTRLDPEDVDVTMGTSMSLLQMLAGFSGGAFEMGELGFAGRACAHGDLTQCRGLFFRSFSRPEPPPTDRYAIARGGWWWDHDVAGGFLSDVVRAVGSERFAAFWHSALPVDSAFAQSFGMSIEEWSHRWLLGMIERPRFGPTVSWSSVLVGLAIAAALVTAAGLYATRRQVG